MKLKVLALLFALTLSVQAQESHDFSLAKQLDIFNNVVLYLDRYYVDTLDAKQSLREAIDHLLTQLDPYTAYYPEDELEDFMQMTTGKYAGIGSPIIYKKTEDRCIFSLPYEGKPAQRAGLRTGDVIMAIDGEDVGAKGTEETSDYTGRISTALRGDPGTTFRLTVKRPYVADSIITVELTRENIAIPPVSLALMLDDSTGYVCLDSYTENTARQLRRSVAELKGRGAQSLVLDLRGNGGGLLSEAVGVVNLFVGKGVEVVSTKGKTGEQNYTYRTEEEPFDTEMPLVVLVDYGTASAAEITAGALQDYDRAVVVGQRTYGKGLVQEPRQLPYSSILKLTTSKYYIPSGRCIQAYDFKHRGADGQPSHLPDSLATTFYTSAGRPVKDGGGILPDVVLTKDSLPRLLTYLQLSDELEDFAVRYRNTHPTLPAPDAFAVDDNLYNDFKTYMLGTSFTYDNQSSEALSLLRRMAAREGYEDATRSEFDALQEKLRPNLAADLDRWNETIRTIVGGMLVANYHHTEGYQRFMLRSDKDLDEARRVLHDPARRQKILSAEE